MALHSRRHRRPVFTAGGGPPHGRTAQVAFLEIHPFFDALPHNMVLRRLSHAGICGRGITYHKAFQSGQTLQVKIVTELSPSKPVTHVIYQGSVPGPLLFNAAFAAPPQCLPRYKFRAIHVATYADDIVIWCVGSARRPTTVRSRLQSTIYKAPHFIPYEVGKPCLPSLPTSSANLRQSVPKGRTYSPRRDVYYLSGSFDRR